MARGVSNDKKRPLENVLTAAAQHRWQRAAQRPNVAAQAQRRERRSQRQQTSEQGARVEREETDPKCQRPLFLHDSPQQQRLLSTVQMGAAKCATKVNS